MQKSVVRTGITLVVSTTVFLGAITPPAVQHAHSGGNQSHGHDADHLANHSHPHSHKHPHPHEPKTGTSPAGMPTLHFHLTFLGLDYHLPINGPQNLPNDGPSLPDAQVESLVRLFDNEGMLKSSVAAWVIDCHSPSVVSMVLPIANSKPRNEGETPTRLLLCDSARGERSGVQLI